MATNDYASWSQRDVERFLQLSTPDRNGIYKQTAEEVAQALGRSRYAIQSMRRKLVKARTLAGSSRSQLVKLLLVGEHRLLKLRTAKIPERSKAGSPRAPRAPRAAAKAKTRPSVAKSAKKTAKAAARKRPAARKGRK